MEVVHSDLDKSPLPFLHLIENIKRTPRTGWMRFIENPESVGDHMYRLSLFPLFAPDGVDKERCEFLALCHDMAEAVAGDIPTFAGVTKEHKFKLEDFGIRYIQSLLNPVNPSLGLKIRTAWLEYEEGKTAESRFIRDMDKFECMVQAHEYEQRTFGEKDLKEFQGLSSKISSSEGKEWLKLLQQERQAHFSKRQRRLPVIFFIGAPGTGKKTQCSLLCQKYGFQHISLEKVIREKSKDQTYPHAQFVKDCLEEKVDVPRELKISLLERKINEGIREGKQWSLVQGFPECIQDLLEFEEKVQKTNHTLLLNCSAEGMFQRAERPGSEAGDKLDIENSIQVFQMCNAEVENYLKAAKGFFKEINGDGSAEEVHDRVTQAVEEFVKSRYLQDPGQRKALP
ncbi:MAG: hypothetical protein Q9217_005174 [Psora testacea]